MEVRVLSWAPPDSFKTSIDILKTTRNPPKWRVFCLKAFKDVLLRPEALVGNCGSPDEGRIGGPGDCKLTELQNRIASAQWVKHYLHKDLLPTFGRQPLGNITPLELGAVVAKVEARKAFNMDSQSSRGNASVEVVRVRFEYWALDDPEAPGGDEARLRPHHLFRMLRLIRLMVILTT